MVAKICSTRKADFKEIYACPKPQARWGELSNPIFPSTPTTIAVWKEGFPT
jgi:hypothetical protein